MKPLALFVIISLLVCQCGIRKNNLSVETDAKQIHNKSSIKEETANNPKDKVYMVADEIPMFPGGNSNMMGYLQTNIKYPKEAINKKIQGRVYVRFIVKADGKLSDISILKSVHPLLDKEAMRVINQMPKWIPGVKDGKKINFIYNLPINFTL